MKYNIKNRIVLAIIFAVSIAVMMGTISYAYFSSEIDVTSQNLTTETGSIAVTFADNDKGINATLNFEEAVTKKFTIKNTGTLDAQLKMYWKDIKNTYKYGSLTYTLQYSEIEGGPFEELVTEENVPRSKVKNTILLTRDFTVPAGKTYYCELKITFKYLDEIDQTSDFDASFSSNFEIKDVSEPEPPLLPSVLKKRNAVSTTEKMWRFAKNIKKIVFEPSLSPKKVEGDAYAIDMSQNEDEQVMCYLVRDIDDSSMYVAYIQGNGKIIANSNSLGLFSGFTNLESIENIELLDTSNVTNMEAMFRSCSNLKEIDLSNFDTRNVTSMLSMFSSCRSLTSIDVSNFDTSKVRNLSTMFANCSLLESLDLSNFDTSQVFAITMTFVGCKALTSLDLRNWNLDALQVNNKAFDDPPLQIKIKINDENIKSKLYTQNRGRVPDANFILETP